MARLSRQKWWIVADILLCPLLVYAAGVPNVFTAGTVISSAQVNANFTAMTNRLTTLETTLGSAVIPDIPDPSTATNPQYDAATSVHLPIYRVTPGQTAGNEGGASCKTGDLLLGGGCVGYDAVYGTETCMVERGYPINQYAWYCRARKANGVHSDCRVTPIAICLKAQ